MKILVLSDSHASLRFMFACVEQIKPDAIVHLGDYYDDGEALSDEFPHIPFYQVAGNCDRYRAPVDAREILILPLLGVNLYMTHGHRHNVKFYTDGLIADARAAGAAAVLYGHTHIQECYQEDDGMWVLNPGSAGSYGGSAGIIEVEKGKIARCYLIGQRDLEEMV